MSEQDTEKRLAIIKIYVKDFSFESPQSPEIFQATEWAPQTNLNLRSSHTKIEDNLHEIVLTLTVEAKDKEGDKTLFLVELQQAGMFDMRNYSQEEFGALVGSFGPNMLFPYARESIATIVQKGGFPEFLLQPINFDALYMQSQAEQAKAQAGDANGDGSNGGESSQ